MTQKETGPVGQISGSAGGRGIGRVGSLYRERLDYGEIRRRFPLGTFLINVTGSFLIGVLMTLLTERLQPHTNWRLFLVVGILGGYTTFSSFEYETYQAVRGGASWMGLAYMMGSVMLGYAGVWLGALLVSRH